MRSIRHVTVHAAAALLLSAITIGCSSNAASHSSSTDTTTTTSAPAVGPSHSPSKLVGVDAFAAKIADPRVVTINVHIPNEGDLKGTDLEIPYTMISSSKALPNNRATPLAIYCRSGNMSAQAAIDLHRLGYTDITELKGGYNAWKATGRTLVLRVP